jgi:hypothetical protein
MTASKRPIFAIIAAISCLLLASCAMLRIQTIRGAKTVWLSRTGDDASLNKLILLNKGKPADSDSLVRLENGAQVYITEWTTKRCKGRDVFIKVQIKDCNNKVLKVGYAEHRLPIVKLRRYKLPRFLQETPPAEANHALTL